MSASSPHSSATLGRRIAGWTSNFLATGIVLVAALGLGRQLVQWWGVESQSPGPPQSLASPEVPAGESTQLHFGEAAAAMQRSRFVGTRELALAALQANCRSVLEADPPATAELPATQGAFFQQSAGRAPAQQHPGRWEIYQFEGSLPIVVGVSLSPASDPSAAENPTQPLAAPLRRVLVWGLAAATSTHEWTLYTYRAQGNSAAAAELDLPLPAQSRRMLALGRTGEATIGFSGRAEPESWQRHFDRLAQERGWSSRGWQIAAGVWQARFVAKDPPRTIDVQFSGGAGRLAGLIVVEQAGP